MAQNNDPTIAIIGAGLSGIAVGRYLKQQGLHAFTIFEKSDAVGGTWYSHSYPGLSCDVPAHVYAYTFEKNPDWSGVYATRDEILRYFQSAARRHGIEPHIRLNTAVKRASYDPSGAWKLELESGERLSFQYLISATGNLFQPKWPDHHLLDTYEGVTWHSARWNHDYDLAGKTVAVIGSGASSAQVIPHVASKAKKLYAIRRTPYWVMPRKNQPYTRWQRWKFRWIPFAAARYRKQLTERSQISLQAFLGNQEMIDVLKRVGKRHLEKHIKDPGMRAALTPSYPPGCKRTLVSDELYPALARDNVELVFESARRLTKNGLVTSSGREIAVDAIVYCTGYQLPSQDLGAPVIGREGKTVGQTLIDQPGAYHGVAIPGFPNYFTVNGPNGALGHTSLTIASEINADYVARLIHDAAESRVKTIEAKVAATNQYNQSIQSELKNSTWAYDCNGFYSDLTGRVLTYFPGNAERMQAEHRKSDLSDYERVDIA